MIVVSGYSATPLARKLGVREESRVLVISAPDDFQGMLDPLPAGTRMVGLRAAFDIAIVFSTRAAGVRERLLKLEPRLDSGARLWVCWPKKSSGVRTDCTFDVVQGAGLETGLVDTKVCAIDEIWSGLCFMRRAADRKRPLRDGAES